MNSWVSFPVDMPAHAHAKQTKKLRPCERTPCTYSKSDKGRFKFTNIWYMRKRLFEWEFFLSFQINFLSLDAFFQNGRNYKEIETRIKNSDPLLQKCQLSPDICHRWFLFYFPVGPKTIECQWEHLLRDTDPIIIAKV